MSYLQFSRPAPPPRALLPGKSAPSAPAAGVIEEAHFWAKERGISLEHDIAGFELNLHFAKPEDMTMFMLSEYSKWFRVVD